MDWHLLETERKCGLVPGVTTDDHALEINDDRLSKAKLFERIGDGTDSVVI